MLPDWLAGSAFAVGIASTGLGGYCVWALRRALARMPTPVDVERCVEWRLMELLPLPHVGDRGTLMLALRVVAPGRPRAVFALGEAPILLARDFAWDTPTPADARWIELHRDDLASGHSVAHERAGVLLPLLTRGGRLTGVVLISGPASVTLDDESRAALRCVAGWLDHAVGADTQARKQRRTVWEPTAATSAARSTT